MENVGLMVALAGAMTKAPSSEQVASAVDAWLEDHPEATTTVTDGSITNAKLATSFVTPGVASAYSSSATYAVGDYCVHTGSLYRCTTAITTAEAWTAAHWAAAVLGDDVSDLKSAIDQIPIDHYNVYYKADAKYIGKKWTSGTGIGMSDDANYDIWRVVISDTKKYYLVKPSGTAYSNSVRFADSSNTYLATASGLSAVNTPPSNAYYMYFRVPNGETPVAIDAVNLANYQAGYKSEIRDDVNYNLAQENKTAIDSIEKCFDKSLNYANPDEFTLNKYMTGEGVAGNSTSYFYTGYIPVQENEVVYSNTTLRYVAGFLNGSWSKSISFDDSSNNSITIPSGVDSVVITGYMSNKDAFMVSKGNWLPYIPFSETVKDNALRIENAGNVYGSKGCTVTESSVSANTAIELTDYPQNIVYRDQLSIKCEFSSFDSLKIGYGNGTGKYFEITSTQVKKYDENSVSGDPENHGLTITNYISVIISVNNGLATVTIDTVSGSYTTTFSMEYNKKGYPFALATMAITNAKLSAICPNFKSSLWWFGDSYSGFDNSRVLGQLRNLGYDKGFLIDALPGQRTFYSATQGGYYEFFQCLKYGMPKYVVWALGMNDSDSIYKEYVRRIINTCNAYNINLILVKPPTVPTVDNTVINAWIEDSGLPFIDWNGAVGATDEGVWYTGFLSSDGVHPNSVGAKALAMQTLVDAPALMQFREEQN